MYMRRIISNVLYQAVSFPVYNMTHPTLLYSFNYCSATSDSQEDLIFKRDRKIIEFSIFVYFLNIRMAIEALNAVKIIH